MNLKQTPEQHITIQEESTRWLALKEEVKKRIVGQDTIVDRIIISILCNGHVLLEGVPGLAKTTLITALAQALGLDFSRVQFTPDLLPSDIIGTLIYSPKTEEFSTKKGPVFANLVLADEINRAPAKVQAALLEAMQERQVTIGDESHTLPTPFFVLATQNPVDQEGTYQLPEAQVDRFMMKLLIEYPSVEDEKNIIKTVFNPQKISKVLSKSDIKKSQEIVRSILVDEKIIDYIVRIINASRHPEEYNCSEIKDYIMHGASPRATLTLYHAAQAHAFLRKRQFVIPDDVKIVASSILRHRITLSYQAEAENIRPDQLISSILSAVKAP